MKDMIEIGPLRPEDRASWQDLFRAYFHFYTLDEPPPVFDRAWDEFVRDERMHALGAWARGCYRVYWMTRETNAVARRLYDQVAQYRGFIKYQIQLLPEAGTPIATVAERTDL